MVVCAREECQLEFYPRTHNQKYCGKTCQKIETNRKVMIKYYKRRDQRAGKARYCIECKVTRLSRYNNDSICGACAQKSIDEARKNLVSWLSVIS